MPLGNVGSLCAVGVLSAAWACSVDTTKVARGGATSQGDSGVISSIPVASDAASFDFDAALDFDAAFDFDSGTAGQDSGPLPYCSFPPGCLVCLSEQYAAAYTGCDDSCWNQEFVMQTCLCNAGEDDAAASTCMPVFESLGTEEKALGEGITGGCAKYCAVEGSGMAGTTDAGTSEDGGTFCEATSTECNDCTSANCDTEAMNCGGDSACVAAADPLNTCLCATPGSAQCVETFAATDAISAAYAQCFTTQCASPCGVGPLDSGIGGD
jgi:hypothetical protein